MTQTTTHSHILSAYDDELKFLTRRIAEMGGLAEQMCADAVRALVNSDAALAQKVISDDAILDHSEREIGDKAIVTIARRQPMAADLREIIGTLRIAGDLERVGDLGKNTAKRVIAVAGTGVPRKLARGIEHLSELALVQAQGSPRRLFHAFRREGQCHPRARRGNRRHVYVALP